MSVSESQKWWLLLATALLGFVFYLLSPVLTPFFAAALLAYLGDPLVDRLEDLGLPRTLSVVIVFVVLFSALTLAVLMLLPMLEQQLSYLVSSIPRYIDLLQQDILPGVMQRLGMDNQALDLSVLKTSVNAHFKQAGGIVVSVLSSISSSGIALLGWLANLVLIPVLTFYLLRDWDLLVARIDELIPHRYEPVVARLARDSDQVLAAFLRGQFMVMLALGCIYATGLWLVGLKLALLIGLLAGLVSFVPYLGFILGLLAASVAVLLQGHELMQLLPVLGVFAVGQLFEGMLLTPWLVGDRIGLHPVAVIFAVLAGGQLFGFVGILLALPVAAVLAVMIRYAHEQYKSSAIFDETDS